MRLGEVERETLRTTRLPSGRTLWTVHDAGTVVWSLNGYEWRHASARPSVGARFKAATTTAAYDLDRAIYGSAS